MVSRMERMLGVARPEGLGLEIGALHSPLLRKPDHQVLYVDYAPTEVIKANQFAPQIPVDQIVDVDIVWGERPLAECVGRRVDYVAASHVIEHVPDLIGWLAEIAEVLRPEGVLGLAIPDMRYTFDVLRPVTSLADVVEAYLLQRKRPPPRLLFEAATFCVAVDPQQLLAGTHDRAALHEQALARAPASLGLARAHLEDATYRDAHCWVFTPESFLELVEELAALQLFPFRLAGFEATPPGAAEFFVRLASAAPDDPAVRLSIAEAKAPASPEPRPPRSDGEVEHLRAEVAALRASTSWRITAPLRALRRLIGGA